MSRAGGWWCRAPAPPRAPGTAGTASATPPPNCPPWEGPGAAARRDVACRRVLVRATGARQRAGYTAIVTNIPAADLPAWAVEPFSEARQTIEGWLSEATEALQLKGLWSRRFCGLE